MNEMNVFVPYFGYELIRGKLMHNLLGKDAEMLLYWAGKQIGRDYPMHSFEEIAQFFVSAGWGELTVQKETNEEMIVTLEGELVSERLKSPNLVEFKLEAGFLSVQIERLKKRATEAFEDIKERKGKIIFKVRWDNEEIIES